MDRFRDYSEGVSVIGPGKEVEMLYGASLFLQRLRPFANFLAPPWTISSLSFSRAKLAEDRKRKQRKCPGGPAAKGKDREIIIVSSPIPFPLRLILIFPIPFMRLFSFYFFSFYISRAQSARKARENKRQEMENEWRIGIEGLVTAREGERKKDK